VRSELREISHAVIDSSTGWLSQNINQVNRSIRGQIGPKYIVLKPKTSRYVLNPRKKNPLINCAPQSTAKRWKNKGRANKDVRYDLSNAVGGGS
jgi:hypothetical protein